MINRSAFKHACDNLCIYIDSLLFCKIYTHRANNTYAPKSVHHICCMHVNLSVNRYLVLKSLPGFYFFACSNSMGEETRNVDPAVLDLGLSLGGCYTQTVPDPIPLTIRTSSSLSRDSNPNQNQMVLTDFFAEPKPPRRPTKAEMELIKVKAEQAMKRLEAKKRLVEKQRRGGFIGGGFCKEEKPPAAVAGSELANWTADSAWRHNAFRRATDQLKNNVGPSANLRIQGNLFFFFKFFVLFLKVLINNL